MNINEIEKALDALIAQNAIAAKKNRRGQKVVQLINHRSHKVCSTCHKSKPLSQFNRIKKANDDRYPRCRECEIFIGRINRKWKRLNGECLSCSKPIWAGHSGIRCEEHFLARQQYDANRRANKKIGVTA